MGLPEDYKGSLTEYTDAWLNYLETLGDYFSNYPAARTVYAEYYKYWAKWYGWYDRWQRMNETDWNAYFTELDAYFTTFPEQRDEYMSQYYQWLQWKQAGAGRAW